MTTNSTKKYAFFFLHIVVIIGISITFITQYGNAGSSDTGQILGVSTVENQTVQESMNIAGNSETNDDQISSYDNQLTSYAIDTAPASQAQNSIELLPNTRTVDLSFLLKIAALVAVFDCVFLLFPVLGNRIKTRALKPTIQQKYI